MPNPNQVIGARNNGGTSAPRGQHFPLPNIGQSGPGGTIVGNLPSTSLPLGTKLPLGNPELMPAYEQGGMLQLIAETQLQLLAEQRLTNLLLAQGFGIQDNLAKLRQDLMRTAYDS